MNISTTWTDTDWDKFKIWLIGMLKVTDVTVTFTKKDGTERIMRCTLQADLLPEKKLTESKPRKKTDEAISVYDLENSSWKSFIWKSVKRVNITI